MDMYKITILVPKDMAQVAYRMIERKMPRPDGATLEPPRVAEGVKNPEDVLALNVVLEQSEPLSKAQRRWLINHVFSYREKTINEREEG